MSFAEEMGHDMPDDNMQESYGSNSSYYSFKRYLPKTEICPDINIKYETTKAYLIEFRTKQKAWVPKSQVVLKENNTVVLMPEWLLDNLNFID